MFWRLFLVFDLVVLGLMEICLSHTFVASSYLLIIAIHYLVLLRVNAAFLLYRREQMTIFPVLIFTLSFGALFLSGAFYNTFLRMAELPDMVFGVDNAADLSATYRIAGRNVFYENVVRAVFLWAWLAPIVVYAALFVQKGLEKRGYTWIQLAGLAVFHDRAGRFFVSLCVLMFIALLAGRHMAQDISFYAVIVLPPVTYYLLNKYVGRKAHWAEYALLIVAMFVFDKAQYRCDTERVLLLALSPAIVLAVSVWMASQTKKVLAAVFAFLMTAFVLPVTSVGYNVYAVQDGARGANYSDLVTRQGVLYVENRHDENGKRVKRFGLRDRYGEILPCVYRNIQAHQ